MDFLLPFASPGYVSLFRKPRAGGKDGFSFFDPAGQGNIMQFLDEYLPVLQQTKDRGLICLVSGNHDTVPRLGDGRSRADLELCFLFLLTMPGVPFIYYGDEIGMRSLEGLPSKEGGLGRTGARTPMQWEAGPAAGFSAGPAEALYLPVDPSADRPTVAAQQADPGSMLNAVRRLIALRREHPSLCASGEFEVVYAEAGRYPFVYRRTGGGETALLVLNPSRRAVEVTLPAEAVSGKLQALYGLDAPFARTKSGWRLQMPPVSGGVYRIG
jgi:maltose alpha-D-glucosyltransferase/alpha-amylase